MQATVLRPAGLKAPLARASRAARPAVVCQAQKDGQNLLALPMATLVATAMITGSMVMPEDALAAKSSGRVGGSSGFAARKAASTSAPASRTTTVYNSTTVIAPPVVAPPVYGGFGFGSPFGFSIMPTFVMPVPFLGGILQFFLIITILSVIFNVVRGAMAASGAAKKKDDGWGDL